MKYGTDTISFTNLKNLEISSENKLRGSDYIPSRYRHLEKIFSLSSFSKKLNFTDIGSGKGRVLLIASNFLMKPRC